MQTTKINIANLKCGGCANTVKSTLLLEKGVETVDVNVEDSLVTIVHSEEVQRENLVQQLTKKGYPELGENNNTLLKAKSYVSCAIGRMK